MRTILLLLLPVLAAACEDGSAGKNRHPGEDFTFDDGVRVTWPTNGETVGADIVMTYEAGADVSAVRLNVDDAPTTVTGVPGADGAGELVVTLAEGRRRLSVVALDDAGDALSQHDLVVRVVVEDESWVSITSPSDGAELPNPVSFMVAASSDVDNVVLEADGWPIGESAPGTLLSYTFTGTGYEREIVASAYDDGLLVATDTIQLTVEPASTPGESELNDLVVALLESYPTDGTNGYYWPSDSDWSGTTRDVWYDDVLVAEGDPEGRCYCVGLTWEVYMRAFQEADAMTGGDGSLNGLAVEDLYEFRTDWFVRDLWGNGIVDALTNYGLGEQVTDLEDVRPGDFLQFWRHSGSGHNNIFIEWIRDGDDRIVGLTYWSTQSSTDGIDYNSEYFGTSGSRIDPSYFFAGRAAMPTDWIPWH